MNEFGFRALRVVAGAAVTVLGLSAFAPSRAEPLLAPDGASGIENVYWTNRCVWVQRGWGSERRCRRVWVGPGMWAPAPPPAAWGYPPPPPSGWGYRPPPPPTYPGPPSGFYRY